MRAILSALVLTGCLVSGIANARVQVCNHSNEKAQLAYAVFSHFADPYTRGWMVIENGQCQVIYNANVNGDTFLIYAEGLTTRRALHNQFVKLCVSTTGGTWYRPDQGDCPADRAVLKVFDNINDSGQRNQPDWDYTLVRAQ